MAQLGLPPVKGAGGLLTLSAQSAAAASCSQHTVCGLGARPAEARVCSEGARLAGDRDPILELRQDPSVLAQ